MSWSWPQPHNDRINIELIYPVTAKDAVPVTTILADYGGSSPDLMGGARGDTLKLTARATGKVQLVAVQLPDGPDATPITLFHTAIEARSFPDGNTTAKLSSLSQSLMNMPDPSSTSSTATPRMSNTGKIQGAIIPSAIGGVLILIAALFLLVFLRHRRRRNAHPEFRRDMMDLLTRADVVTSTSHHHHKYPREEKTSAVTEGSRHFATGSIPLTTSLREEFQRHEGDRSSVSTSVYSHGSAEARAVAASAISDDTSGSSQFRTPSLIPVSINSPLSLAHLKAPLRARTDRQMEIKLKLIELQGRSITAGGPEEEKIRTRAELQEKIE
ncbi:hypothetical protein PQX77_001705 [Marasmius sp. AFHP31]|nr:hypothetical protein PQX77_001705 [Marasmius sp. AFHP31]